jgi:predicted aminopeptidase
LRETVCEAGHGHICTQPLQRGDRTFDGARQLSRHEADRRHSAEFLAPMSKIRDEIKQVYDSSGTSEQMAAAKAATIDELRTRYRQMRDKRWAGCRGYDAWFRCPNQQREARRDCCLR